MWASEAQQKGRFLRAGTAQQWDGISPLLAMCKQTLDCPRLWEAEHPICLLYTQMHISKAKAPRSQALKKFTCFASLTCLLDYGIPSSQMPVNICKDVVFHGTGPEKFSYGRFGQ